MFIWTIFMVLFCFVKLPYWLALARDYLSCAVNLLVRLLFAFFIPICQDCGEFLISCTASSLFGLYSAVDGYFPCVVKDLH